MLRFSALCFPCCRSPFFSKLTSPRMSSSSVAIPLPENCIVEVLEDYNESGLHKQGNINDDMTTVGPAVAEVRTDGIGTVCGNLVLGTAERMPVSKIVDTTAAGYAFIGAAVYAICANMPPEKILPFATLVAAACCRALGARSGLPRLTDPHLASFFHEIFQWIIQLT